MITYFVRESFEELIQLEQLHIQGNDITAMSEIEHLVVLPKLKVLSLQNVDGSDPNPGMHSSTVTI